MDKQLIVLAVVLGISVIPAALFVGFIGGIVYMFIQSGGSLQIRFFHDRIAFHSQGGHYSGVFSPPLWLFFGCLVSFVIFSVSLFLLIRKRRILRKQREQKIESYTV